MISFEEALERTLDLAEPLDSETISLPDANGRVLVRAVTALRDQPPFKSSAMDGYAVRSHEVRQGSRFRVIGTSAAGARFLGGVGVGEAVRVFTGAPVPDCTDRVVIQEDVTRTDDVITINADASSGFFVRPAGSDYAAGNRVTAPRRLCPSSLALLASMNARQVEVTRPPRVAILATGDELVALGEETQEDQIVSSNNYGIKAIVESEGGCPQLLPIAADSKSSIRFNLELARGADVIVTLGGASVGDHDLVRGVAVEAGLELAFHKVALRPGKPLMVGKIEGKLFVGIPGNPVSSIVCGHVFLRPVMRAMLGLGRAPLPLEPAILGADVPANGPRQHLMCAKAAIQNGRQTISAFERQDSSLLSVLAQSNALLVRPPRDRPRTAGDAVEWIRM